MTLDGSALALEPAPRSVQRARRWVADVCRSAGRPDLVEAAETGTSELVTNALLHAPGPIDLRVSGTAEHLRIEVHDASPVPPRPAARPRLPEPGPAPDPASDPAPDPGDLDALLASLGDELSTVGRGLHIVATSAHAWGAEITAEGKVVWFEPAPDLRDNLTDAELAGSVYATGEAAAGTARPGIELVGVRLLGVPTDRLAAFRRHHLELRRELRLLALAHASEYPQAERLSALFSDFESDVGPAVSGPQVVAALASGRRYADLELSVPATAPASAETMLRLLDLADEFCRGARLLTLARSDDQVMFARWFLGELAAQAAGAPATPWDAEPEARYWSP